MLNRRKKNFILIFADTLEGKLWMAKITAITMYKQIFLNRTIMTLKSKYECQRDVGSFLPFSLALILPFFCLM